MPGSKATVARRFTQQRSAFRLAVILVIEYGIVHFVESFRVGEFGKMLNVLDGVFARVRELCHVGGNHADWIGIVISERRVAKKRVNGLSFNEQAVVIP